MTRLGTTWSHACEVHALTAAKVERSPPRAIADSMSGSGGVCSVVSIGTATACAMAIGRGWRLWLWMTS